MLNREVVSRNVQDIRGGMLRTMKEIRRRIEANKRVSAVIITPHNESTQDVKIVGMGPAHLISAAYHVLGSAAIFLERDIEDVRPDRDRAVLLKSLEVVRTAEAMLRTLERSAQQAKPRGDA